MLSRSVLKTEIDSDSDIKNPNRPKFDIADSFPTETACNPQFKLEVTK